MEEWKSITGYEGLYEVSSYGRVRSLDRYVKSKSNSNRLQKGKVLSPTKHKTGYLVVNLKNKMFRVHRLVAQAFISNPEGLSQVNHKDEDKTNNSGGKTIRNININIILKGKRVYDPLFCCMINKKSREYIFNKSRLSL